MASKTEHNWLTKSRHFPSPTCFWLLSSINFRAQNHLTEKSRIFCRMKNLNPINRLGKSPLRDQNIRTRAIKESETEEKTASKIKRIHCYDCLALANVYFR